MRPPHWMSPMIHNQDVNAFAAKMVDRLQPPGEASREVTAQTLCDCEEDTILPQYMYDPHNKPSVEFALVVRRHDT